MKAFYENFSESLEWGVITVDTAQVWAFGLDYSAILFWIDLFYENQIYI